MAITIKDIADKADVSYSTVSLVLNGKAKQNRISKGVEERVIAIAKELNYLPNTLAVGLRKGVTHSVGFVVSYISNAFFVKLARYAEKEAMKYGYRVFFASSDESDERCEGAIDAFLNQQVDGLIIVPTQGIEKKISQLNEQNIPFVLVDRYFPKISANYVTMNNWQSSYDATEHLLKKGKKRIATFTYNTGFYHMAERLEGYKAALKDYGIRYNRKLTPEVPFLDSEGINERMKEYIPYLVNECKIDGIYFQTNGTALPGIFQLHELGKSVAREISIVCFNDNQFFDLLEPRITSLNQPIEELGVESVRILIDEIKNKRGKGRKTRSVYSASLIERGD